jgi:hypothetical protein
MLGEQPGIFWCKIPQNNFSTNEPISKNMLYLSIQLDQRKNMKTLKRFSKFILGEQPGSVREKATP